MMKEYLIASLLLLAPAYSLAQNAAEYQQYVQDSLAASTIRAKGTVSPESIPFGEKMAAAFLRFEAVQKTSGRSNFQQQFNARYGGTSEEAKAISNYVADAGQFRRTLLADEIADISAYCKDGSKGEGTTPIELASRFNAIEDDRLARLEAHYRSVLETLSARTRAILLSQVEAEVLPQMTYARLDYARLVVEAPDVFAALSSERCSQGLAHIQEGATESRVGDGSSPVDTMIDAE
jgi:hypothetical protein